MSPARPALVRADLARLKSLAMPPAYVDVRYAPEATAHLQAVGTDAAGRVQYDRERTGRL